jgi:hypothetical protein
MPFVEDANKKGDLIIEFEIEFPHSLNPDSKDYVRRALLVSPNHLHKLETKAKSVKNSPKFEYEEEE